MILITWLIKRVYENAYVSLLMTPLVANILGNYEICLKLLALEADPTVSNKFQFQICFFPQLFKGDLRYRPTVLNFRAAI